MNEEFVNKFNEKNKHLNLEKIKDTKRYFLKIWSYTRNIYEFSCMPWAVKSVLLDSLSFSSYEMFEKYIYGLFKNKAILIFKFPTDAEYFEINQNDQFVETVLSIIQNLYHDYFFDKFFDLKEPNKPSIELKDAGSDIKSYVTNLWKNYEQSKLDYDVNKRFISNLELLIKNKLDAISTYDFINDFNRLNSQYEFSLRILKDV